MKKLILSLSFIICTLPLAQAAVVNTNITVTGSATSSASTVTASGTTTLSGLGSGTFSSSFNLITAALSGSAPVSFAITSGSPVGTLTGTLVGSPTLLVQVLTGNPSASGPAVINITSGTGGYTGVTGSFNVTAAGTGAGTTTAGSGNFSLTGAGSLNIPGATGGGGGTPAPTLSAILDAASYTSGIAQGSIFVVKGTNLSPAGFTQNSGYPLSTTLGGVKITFTPLSGGAATDCFMVYLYNQDGVNQLAALLPSTVTPGTYNVTVTNNGTVGAVFTAQVVARKLGLITRDSSGSGLAVVQNYRSATKIDIDAYTTQTLQGVSLSPGYPGITMVAYGTGFGAVGGAADNVASAGYNFAANGVNVSVLLGGIIITPAYAGRTPGSSGLDQINFTLPANSPTGCAVPFQISVNGTLSPLTYLAIAPDANAVACVQPGFTNSQLQQFDQGTTVYSGGFSIVQFSQTVSLPTGSFIGKFDVVGGSFTKFSGFQLGALLQSGVGTNAQEGNCYVTQPSTGGASGGGSGTNLNAGTITLSGPGGSNLSGPLTQSSTNSYSKLLGFESSGGGLPPGFPSTNVNIVAGVYSLAGAGGPDVGNFNASVNLGPALVVTGGLPLTVNRASGLTVNFSGGNPSDQVILAGTSSVGSATTSFVCYGTAGARSIVAPASILTQLPAGGTGTLSIISGVNAPFTAPITAGGNINASFSALVGTANTPTYQ